MHSGAIAGGRADAVTGEPMLRRQTDNRGDGSSVGGHLARSAASGARTNSASAGQLRISLTWCRGGTTSALPSRTDMVAARVFRPFCAINW